MQPGDVIAAKYRVERVIGRGGMGVVVAATHLELGHAVALKFLLPNALENAEVLARFEREARACVALRSDHVSRVHDVGRLPDGAPYIVMELLEGADLGHELHRRGPLPVHEAVGYVVQACDAIAEAHALGIVHRDLKPSNLFLAKRRNREPIVKVLDFGISKATSMTDAPSALTATTALIGSPLYMSPEQLRTPKEVDARADVWSLGATLYELLTGVAPFGGETLAELSANILTVPAPDVRTRAPNVPDELAEVISRALEKRPEARVASVEELARALGPFGAPGAVAAGVTAEAPDTGGAPAIAAVTPKGAQHTLPLLPAPAPPPSPNALSDVGVSYRPPAAPPRRSGLPIVAGAVVLTLAGAGALWQSKRGTLPAPPGAQSSLAGSAQTGALEPAAVVGVGSAGSAAPIASGASMLPAVSSSTVAAPQVAPKPQGDASSPRASAQIRATASAPSPVPASPPPPPIASSAPAAPTKPPKPLDRLNELNE